MPAKQPRTYTPPQPYTDEPRPPIALSPVVSSQVAAIGYDEESKTLAVTFTRGEEDQRAMDLGHEYDPDGDGKGMEPGPGDDVSDARILSLTDGPLDSELEQAYQDGYQAYLDGKPKTDCPVMRHELVAKWTAGWQDAKEANEDDPSVATGDGGAA